MCICTREKKKKRRRRREGGERDKDLIKDNLVLACQATRDKLNASLPPSLPCSVRRRLSSNESKTQFRTVTMVSTKKWVIISLVSKICQIETRKIQRKWLYRSSQTKTRQNDLCWKSTCFLQSTYSHIHIYVYDYIDIRHVCVYMCVFVYKLRQKHGCTSCKLQIQSLIQICSRQRHLAHIRKIN